MYREVTVRDRSLTQPNNRGHAGQDTQFRQVDRKDIS
jgi:hypothetical protein